MIQHNLKLSGGGKRTATAYAGQILLEDTMFYFDLAAAADRLLPAPGSNRGSNADFGILDEAMRCYLFLLKCAIISSYESHRD